MQLYYKPRTGCPVHGDGDAIALSDGISKSIARGLDKQLQQLYNDVASDPALIIHKDIFTYTRSQLHRGIDQVFGDPKFGDADFDLVQNLRNNADRFAGYKSAWQTAHIRSAEPDQMPDINSRYNVNWMRTEYVHTVRSARAAKNWQAIDQDKDLYPFLEYMPSTAAEPRNEHQRLYGVVKPVDDPFWDTWLPPSDWGCRCSVKQVRNNEGAKQPPDDIKLPPATMRNNPGKSGQLFTDEHPMIAKIGQRNKAAVISVYEKLQRKVIRDEAIDVMKTSFLGEIFHFNLSTTVIKTEPLTNKYIKEIVNQPVRNLNFKNELCKQLSHIVGNSEILGNPVPSSKDKFSHFYYFRIKGTDLMFNIGKKHSGEFVLYSITDIKKPV
jgi:hypothetical protein